MLLKELVTEGTWAAPQTLEQAQELAKLLQNPLPAGTATALIFDLVGADDLFDNIDNAKDRDPNQDVRPLIFDKLNNWLHGLRKDQTTHGRWRTWTDPWDPEAVKLLRRLTRMRV